MRVLLGNGAGVGDHVAVAARVLRVARVVVDVQREIAEIRRRTEASLAERIVRDIEAGVITAGVSASESADALAGHVMAVIQGMSTLARDGATREKLLRVAATAMRAWPLPD